MTALWTRRSVVVFFLVGLGVPWLGWTTLWVTGAPRTSAVGTALFYTGDFMTVAGFVAAYVAAGGAGLRSLLRRCFRIRTGIGWALLALFIPMTWAAVPALIGAAVGDGVGRVDLSGLAAYFAPGVLLALTTGPLGEEVGWRGFLQPRVMRAHSPLVGSFIIGVIWSIWHVPLYWNSVFSGVDSAVQFTIATVSYSLLFTVLWAYSGGSVFWAIILHWTVNISPRIVAAVFPDLPRAGATGEWIESAVMIVVAAVVFGAVGRERLNRRLEGVMRSLEDESIDMDRASGSGA